MSHQEPSQILCKPFVSLAAQHIVCGGAWDSTCDLHCLSSGPLIPHASEFVIQ
jgi:hypothetical protein